MQDIIVRPHDPSDNMMPSEVAFINEFQGRCPDCRQGELMGGPRGGLAQNFRCDLCHSEFNLTLFPDTEPFVIDGHRLARDEPDAYQLASLRSRWGKLDDSPPPGVSKEQWDALTVEADAAMRRIVG